MPEDVYPWGRPAAIRVRIAQPGGDQIFDNVYVNEEGGIEVTSIRPPEEVFRFGLPIGASDSFQTQRTVRYIPPAERSITQTRDDGLCVYCQLLLLPDAPQHARHQPSLHLLIESAKRCNLCAFLNGSISMGSSELRQMWEARHPMLNEPRNSIITVESKKYDRYSQLVATVGNPAIARWQGRPVVWTTDNRLGKVYILKVYKTGQVTQSSIPRARLDLMKHWLAECLTSHQHCTRLPSQSPPMLPTRVLKISWTGPPDYFNIKLHISNGEHAHYIALSHCWGSANPLKTVKANLHVHQESIPFQSLPPTFYDAVVNADNIGCCYLWIDSLCIIQDDQDDWETEAAQMASVYANAMITFAATGAVDSSEGCASSRVCPLLIPITGNEVARVRLEEHFLDCHNAPLNLRAWTFQEALLSPRMICFDNPQMFWKCSSMHESEDGLFCNIDLSPKGGDRLPNLQVWLQNRSASSPRHDLWYQIVEIYSRRRMTKESDRIAALAGVLQEYQHLVGGQPVAGLWKDDLVHGLLWRTPQFTQRIQGLGSMPSWSWASVSGEINWPPRNQDSEDRFDRFSSRSLEVISAAVGWTGPATTSIVLDSKLTVQGRLVAARLGQQTLGSQHNSYQVLTDNQSKLDLASTPHSGQDERREGLETEVEELGYGWLDEKLATGSLIWCLETYSFHRMPVPGLERNELHRVLLLTLLDGTKQLFRRIGTGELWRYSLRRGKHWESMVKETMIDAQMRTLSVK
ncbi:heterokaryon incompatibility protein-domain-containing protein [Aspergillus terricola var. indicus]